MAQQDETLGFFRSHAETWAAKAQGRIQKYNVIAARNAYVMRTVKGRRKIRRISDVGCGTGDLCCALAEQGFHVTGIDFAPEMIHHCERNAEDVAGGGLDFHCVSIFDFEMAPESYDLISANGLIEYISVAELRRFLSIARTALAVGGSLVLGSRNRLFNIFSCNAFTEDEIRLDAARFLLAECIAIAGGTALRDLAHLPTPPLPSDDATYQRTTGIEVTTRHQYTPAQMIKLVVEAGFEPCHLGAVHIHGVPPQVKDVEPQAHIAVAEFLERFADNQPALIPQASTFMLHAVRP